MVTALSGRFFNASLIGALIYRLGSTTTQNFLQLPRGRRRFQSEISGADQEEKMAISKILAISYAVTLLIFFAVVGALEASQAAI